jgi:hypothetical protein
MRALVTGVGLALAITAAAAGQAAARQYVAAQFGCDGRPGTTCYFSLVNYGGIRTFTIRAGVKERMRSVYIGQPFYVSIDYPNYGSPAVCQRLVAEGKFCQLHQVKPGYNN